jgi:ferredoxin-NADP reductase
MPTPVKLPAIVEQVIQHTDSVKTVLVRPAKKCPMFRPGQFLHLAMDAYDPSSNWPESRVFSIASSPTRRDTLRIIFSVKGRFTRKMFDGLKAGDEIYVKLPYGSFTFPDDNRGLVLVAGGTGITPFLSYLEYAVDQRVTRPIILYYGIRDPEHLVCGPLLAECQEALQNLKCRLYLEHGTRLADMEVAGSGYIPAEVLLRERETIPNAPFYLSGPTEMVSSFRARLLAGGVSQTQVLVDDWE